MSRLRTVALLVVIAALTAAFAACGGGASGEAPQKVLDSASLEGLESGNLDLAFHVKSAGREGGDVDVHVSGPFRQGKNFPEVGLMTTIEGTAKGKPVDFEGGLTLLSNRAFVDYEGVGYEISPYYFQFATYSFLPPKPNQGKKGTITALSACQEAAGSIEAGDFGEELSNEGSADVEGTETTKVSGELDVATALDAIIELAEDPSCSAQLAAAGRSADELKKAKGELAGAVKQSHVDVYVGDDGIIRKIDGELKAEPKGGDQDDVEAEFELTLSEVNEELEIKTPAGGKPILSWFEGLGVEPTEVAVLASGGEGLGRLLEIIGENIFPSE